MSSSHSSLPAIGVDVGFFSTKYTTGRRDKRSPHAVEVMQFPSVAPRISGSMKSITSADRLSGAQVEVEPGALHFVGTDVYQVAPTTPARHDLNRSALGVAMPLNGLAVSTEALPNTVTQQGSPDQYALNCAVAEHRGPGRREITWHHINMARTVVLQASDELSCL